MEKKFSIKEAWLPDENGNKSLRLNSLDPSEAFKDSVDQESVRGGFGKSDETKYFMKIREVDLC
ncbi:hypothetical protein D3C76_1706130 [compost metagenome]